MLPKVIVTLFGLARFLKYCPISRGASSDTHIRSHTTKPSIPAIMGFSELTEIELPAAFDAHVHLRDGEMSQLVTPTIRKGGVNQVFVMVS